ncbi:sensor histidine kinase [Actinoallomurus iriomotensis]|uniref:histidine kinase n=1 Tax=Actinoallomurus iriomotensis TaxID=478107 RepID=A0A9W6S0F6_9ACTN|nr:histidine kinase [Actinoallomurus iriomotensis]GLY85021.1 two-component sensor histidine kinase [Actinoallomurus iriomotensis]
MIGSSPEAGPGALVARWGLRLRTLAGRHPAAVDSAFALVVLLFGAPHLFREPPKQPLLGWALQIALLVPLIWRRRTPFTAFSVVAALAFAQWLGGVLLSTGDVAVLIALYSVAAHSTLRRLLVAAGIVELGVALATVQWAPPGHLQKVFVLLSGMTTAAAVIGLNMRTRRAYLASVEDRAARLEKERDQQAQIVAAEERARIARDVHDIVTHSLSVMVALTDGAAYALPVAPERAAEAVSKSSEIGRQAIAEMQRVLDVLRQDAPPAAGLRRPQPGLGQLDALLTEVRAAGLPVEFVVTGQPPAMASGAELTIYRLVQEALTNVRKHTPPGTGARVRLEYTAAHVEVEITDDGRPAAGVPAGRRTGHGIAGMRERVAVYGGRLRAGPLPDGGWRVHARFEPSQLRSTR